jgi:hypothetical protein
MRMLNPTSVRRRFGTFLPKLVVTSTTLALIAFCLHFLGGLQSSEQDGITYTVHFPDIGWFTAFVAAMGAVIGFHFRATRWLARRDDDAVDRERRLFAKISDYNEGRERASNPQNLTTR